METQLSRLALVAASLVALTGCPEKAKAPPAGVKPVAQLDAEGKAPLQLVSSSASIAPLPEGAMFNVTIKNVSDARVTMFKSVVLLLDESGKLVPDGQSESGWSELSGIEPGESVQLSLGVPTKGARLSLVFKEVFYDFPSPVKDFPPLTKKWTNSRLDQELAAVKAR